jgi:hypothetical protein
VSEVLLDVVPCEVLLPDGTLLTRARAFVTDVGVVVLREPERGVVEKAYSARHVAEAELDDTRKVRRRQRHVVHGEDGDVVINPVLGCMCHYPGLRQYDYERVRAETRV